MARREKSKPVNDLILREENYEQTMLDVAVPYLTARKRERYLSRAEGKRLYCASYLADDAVGTVVMSHGFTETEEKYQESIYYFLKNHYNVYMHDHCGHGRSYRLVKDLGMVHVDSYGRYVRDVLAVARLAKKEHPGLPLYLFGHSMGGGVAAAALSVRPELFDRAILSSPMIRPLTNGLPWTVASSLAALLCRMGRSARYVPGGHPFDGKETFENSPSTSWERYEYYQKKRETTPMFQMTSPSCGWLYGAARLNRYLQKTAWKNIQTPVLLFQAEKDTFVSGSQQKLFVRKINKAGLTMARLVRMPETKHEIFNSSTEVLERYWKEILDFLAPAGTDSEKCG